MSARRTITLILVVGSVWGMLEVLLWDLWHFQEFPYVSAVLAAAALFCLAAARRVIDVPGSSLGIALVACFYKTASVAFFACQITGVLALAVSFEIFALVTRSIWGKESVARPYFMGLLTVYPALFAFTILTTFVFLTPHWAGTGWTRILPYLGWGAVLGTIGGTLTSAAGWWAGEKLLAEKSLRWKAAIPAAAAVWAVALIHALGQ